MKQLVFLVCIITLTLFSACQGKPTAGDEVHYPILIPFEKAIDQEKKMTLSQIAKEVKYIPLETTENSLVGNALGSKIVRLGDNWYIPGFNDALIFAADGKYVGPLGKRGEGPGEYNYIRYLYGGKGDKSVLLLTNGKVIEYSSDGTWLRDIRVVNGMQFALLNDTTMAFFQYNYAGQSKDILQLTNMKGDSIGSFPQYDRFSLTDGSVGYSYVFSNDRYFYTFKDQVCFKDYYNDTLFTVSPDRMEPRYILAMGKYKLPLESRYENLGGSMERFQREASPYLRPSVLESEGYLFFPTSFWAGHKGERDPLLIYDKGSGECYEIQNGEFANDLDQGPAFYPENVLDDNTLLSVYPASYLLKLAEKDPELLERIDLPDLTEDDNPVLMLVTLK